METTIGIFHSAENAESAVQQLYTLGIPSNRIGLLTPGAEKRKTTTTARIPVEDAEPPGIGKALGATVGGALGVAGGATMGAALASLIIPGVGPVIAGGLIGAAILGAGGTAAGLAAGERLEESLTEGLPHDEVYLIEDALRKGHSVLIALTEDNLAAEEVERTMAQAGAETTDAAAEDWWLGLRSAEQESYEEKGGDFRRDEVSYRHGFQAALHPERRGKGYDQKRDDLKEDYPGECESQAFRSGYERGQVHQKKLTEMYPGK
jgi:hypothetical protein